MKTKKPKKIYQVFLNETLIYTSSNETHLIKFLKHCKKLREDSLENCEMERIAKNIKDIFGNEYEINIYVPKDITIDKYEIITKTI